jgi:hypothetical protein
MASFLPFIQDILPMILPSSIYIAKADDIDPSRSLPAEATDGTEGASAAAEQPVVSRDAIVNKTDKMCATGESPPNLPSSFYTDMLVIRPA